MSPELVCFCLTGNYRHCFAAFLLICIEFFSLLLCETQKLYCSHHILTTVALSPLGKPVRQQTCIFCIFYKTSISRKRCFQHSCRWKPGTGAAWDPCSLWGPRALWQRLVIEDVASGVFSCFVGNEHKTFSLLGLVYRRETKCAGRATWRRRKLDQERQEEEDGSLGWRGAAQTLFLLWSGWDRTR